MQGSPFLCLVQPGEADAQSSRLYGPGLQAIQLGKPSSLFVQLADQWGNAVSADSPAMSGIKVLTQTCACMVEAGVLHQHDRSALNICMPHLLAPNIVMRCKDMLFIIEKQQQL